MPHQLDFWPAAHKAPHGQETWEALSNEEQTERTAILARLIAQAVCPDLAGDTGEESREP